MSVLVTGSAGFVGKRIVNKLIEYGEEPVCFDLVTQDKEQLPRDAKVVVGDITRIEDIIDAVLSHGVTKLIHLAYVMAAECERDPQTAFRVNMMGTNNVLEASRICKVQRLVYTSSNAYYGAQTNFGERPLCEDDFGYPASIYSAHKQLNEYMVQKYVTKYGLSIGIARMVHLHGHGRKSLGIGGWFGAFASNPAIGEPVHLAHKLMSKFCVIYVDDAVDLLIRICQASSLKHSVYNSGGYTVSLDELANIVREFIPGAKISFGKPAEFEVAYLFNDKRVFQDFGFKRRNLRQGILDHINEARQFAGLAPIKTKVKDEGNS